MERKQKKLPPQAFENDFTPGEVSKKSAPPGFLERHARFIAEKRKIVERATRGTEWPLG